jgi:type IV pilus assembly protein PilM
MHFNIFDRQLPLVGLQLNGTSLKFLQLAPHPSKVLVQSYSYSPLPKNVMVNDAINNVDTLVHLIQENLAHPSFGTLTTNRVAMSVPESKSFVRVIQVPEMSEQELEHAVIFEAEAYIPLPIDQVYFDWQIVRHRPDNTMDVIIIATPKEIVDKYIATLEKAGLHVVAVEAESQSLQRAVLDPEVLATALLVDLDAFRTNLVMVEKGNLQFTSSIPIAGNTFTERIAQALGISLQKAEAVKKQVGIANTPEYPNMKTIILPLLNNLGAEIQNIIQFHYDHSTEKIERLILAGGNAKMQNLVEFLTAELKNLGTTRIEVANPWQNIKGLENPPLNPYDSLQFTSTIGLAMRALLK